MSPGVALVQSELANGPELDVTRSRHGRLRNREPPRFVKKCAKSAISIQVKMWQNRACGPQHCPWRARTGVERTSWLIALRNIVAHPTLESGTDLEARLSGVTIHL